jgi:cardiolipin synthase
MELKLVKSGKEYFKILAEIVRQAEKFIHLQTYIFEEDETGLPIAELLQEAAQRGVKVYILLDAFGSKPSETFIKNLKDARVNIRLFSPIRFLKFQIGRRLHQKIVVVDEKYALLGGINIANKYAGYTSTAWLDYAVLIENKSLIEECQRICLEFWNKKYSRLTKSPPLNETKNQIVQHDFVRRKQEIGKTYQKAIQMAKEEIIIVASYFLPNKKILSLLKKASKRNVAIKIMVSKYSDVMIFKKATEYLYKDLLQNNIQVFEYLPSVVHAKVMIVDKKWCTIGSFNLNAISEYGSIELNANIAEPLFVKQVHAEISHVLQNECSLVNKNDIQLQINWWAKFNYVLVRFLIRFFFWILKKAKSYKKQHE